MASAYQSALYDSWAATARKLSAERGCGWTAATVARLLFWRWRVGPSHRYQYVPARLADLTRPEGWLRVCCRRRGWPPEEATHG
jgi:hypothetical protein